MTKKLSYLNAGDKTISIIGSSSSPETEPFKSNNENNDYFYARKKEKEN